jgi:hypothetical protein
MKQRGSTSVGSAINRQLTIRAKKVQSCDELIGNVHEATSRLKPRNVRQTVDAHEQGCLRDCQLFELRRGVERTFQAGSKLIRQRSIVGAPATTGPRVVLFRAAQASLACLRSRENGACA